MKNSDIFFILTLCITSSMVTSYDVTLSQGYLKMEVHKWSNFTVHIETRGYVYVDSVTMELNHTNDIRVSPKIVEIHSENFSSWCHMFHVYAVRPGLSKIQFNSENNSLGNDIKEFHLDVDVVRMKALEPYADWCRKYYYIFSTISLYPQLFLQFLRLSVVGLDMNYVCFNLISHFSYGTYTFFMYMQLDFQKERHPEESFSVTLTENMFALHGLIIAALLGLQSIKYYGVDKHISVFGKELISFCGIIFSVALLLSKFGITKYTDFLYVCLYIHVATTFIKYIPQLYRNYMIKSTFGWNIWNSNLEIIGCISLMASFFITAYNYDNWMGIAEDVLFWMVCLISLQHVAFIIQHYFVYNKQPEFDPSEFPEFTLEEKISLYEQRLAHV